MIQLRELQHPCRPSRRGCIDAVEAAQLAEVLHLHDCRQHPALDVARQPLGGLA